MKPTFPIEGFDTFIICEAGPLVTIGMEAEYSRLPRPLLPVLIPDMVYQFATGSHIADGNPTTAYAVLEWVRNNSDDVRVVNTMAGLEHGILVSHEAGDRLERHGLFALVDTVERYLSASTGSKAILIFDDPASSLRWSSDRLQYASIDDFLDLTWGRYANAPRR